MMIMVLMSLKITVIITLMKMTRKKYDYDANVNHSCNFILLDIISVLRHCEEFYDIRCFI